MWTKLTSKLVMSAYSRNAYVSSGSGLILFRFFPPPWTRLSRGQLILFLSSTAQESRDKLNLTLANNSIALKTMIWLTYKVPPSNFSSYGFAMSYSCSIFVNVDCGSQVVNSSFFVMNRISFEAHFLIESALICPFFHTRWPWSTLPSVFPES